MLRIKTLNTTKGIQEGFFIPREKKSELGGVV